MVSETLRNGIHTLRKLRMVRLILISYFVLLAVSSTLLTATCDLVHSTHMAYRAPSPTLLPGTAKPES